MNMVRDQIYSENDIYYTHNMTSENMNIRKENISIVPEIDASVACASSALFAIEEIIVIFRNIRNLSTVYAGN